MKRLFSLLFDFFGRHRTGAAILVVVLAAGSWLALYRAPLSTDISALLPDRGSRAAADFKLLAQAPLTRRLLIDLKAREGTGRQTLLAAADSLAANLRPPLFQRVIRGPKIDPASPEFQAIGYQWANLMSAADLEQISRKLTPAAVARALDKVRQRLLLPLSFLEKERLRSDPLDFGSLIFGKLKSLNPIPGAGFSSGHFLSPDGRNTLLIVETPIEITDYAGSEKLLQALSKAFSTTLPDSIAATAISGHFYTVANARAVRSDMLTVVLASLLALGLTFLTFLRTRRGLLVFFLPLLVVGPALALTAAIQGSVSAISVGFGAVLLGVTIDYALHPYFALASAPRQTPYKQVLARLSPPILGAGATTIGAFASQLFSSLPGQRQLALLTILGILLALGTALLILPHFLRPRKEEPDRDAITPPDDNSAAQPGPTCRTRRAGGAIIVWIILLAGLTWSATGLRYNGDLRRLNLVPERLHRVEEDFRQTWGGIRSRALAFTRGPSREAARSENDRLYESLRRRFATTEIVSLAPLLPALATQAANRKRWHRFWSREKITRLAALLRRAGRQRGFSAGAFSPFLANLSRERPPLNETTWRRLGLGTLLDGLEKNTPDRTTILSLLPDKPQSMALLARNKGLTHTIFISPRLFNLQVGRVIAQELQRSVFLALLIVTVILLVWLRRPFLVFLALLPVLSGLMTMFGVMGWLGYGFNLFNLVATILMIGLGVDYGIFMVYRLFRDLEPSAEKAVLVSALTTLSGFGVLVLARHPALHSIGLTILLGVCGALPTVIWIVPALAAFRDPSKKRKTPSPREVKS